MVIIHYNRGAQDFFNGCSRATLSPHWGFACEGRGSGLARWHDNSRVSSNILLRVRENVKEGWLNYFRRSSFNILQVCANSRPGRIRIPEVMQMDGLGFSLCAVLLDIIRSCISKWHGSEPQQENGDPVYSRPGESETREQEDRT